MTKGTKLTKVTKVTQITKVVKKTQELEVAKDTKMSKMMKSDPQNLSCQCDQNIQGTNPTRVIDKCILNNILFKAI